MKLLQQVGAVSLAQQSRRVCCEGDSWERSKAAANGDIMALGPEPLSGCCFAIGC
jgi:hypothetical protein